MSGEAGGAHLLKRYPVWSWAASWVRIFVGSSTRMLRFIVPEAGTEMEALFFACFVHLFITSRGMAASITSGRTAGDIPSEYQKSVNPFFLAMSKFRRRRWEEVIDICSGLLKENPRDESAWFLNCRALTMKNFIDDLECDEDPLGDLAAEEGAMNSAPRPGTSLQRSVSKAIGKSRPTSNNGRPITGFVRPGTNSD
ncbi:Tetratricopeptide repeat protein 8, partial [Perkinsus olseni]